MIRFSDLLEVKGIDEKVLYQKISKRKKKPWVDKYRPKKVRDIIYQDELKKVLNNTIKTGELPHLLLYGPPGTGKTSIILAISKELFGPKKYQERVLELNASDERGINIVRNKIITFAKNSVGTPDPNYPCPEYKIIILDEADAMTTEAQLALRKVMEEYSKITRFCFICNYINKIINPIISRCMTFRFKPLNKENMVKKLYHISQNEKINCEKECLNEIAEMSHGDMRKAITLLQNLNYINTVNQKKITVNDMNTIVSQISYNKVKELVSVCIKYPENNNIEHIRQCALYVKKKGYPLDTVVQNILKYIIECNDINDKKKAQICIKLSHSEQMILDGGDEYLQLLNIFSYINRIINDI